MTIKNILKWENTAHITKTTMQAGFAIAFVVLAATAIYAAAKGATLPLAFLAKPWIIAAIVSCVAVYFAAQAYSSYQQMNAMEGAKGKDGVDGKDGTPGKVLSDDDLKGKVKEILPTLLGASNKKKILLNRKETISSLP